MKTAFILFVLLTDPSGADRMHTMAYSDLGHCEYQRQKLAARGLIVGDHCARMTYKVTSK